MSGSSGDEGVLQIDVSEPAVKPKAKGGRKEKTTWKTGDVVWAKVSGFNYWPAKVFDQEDDLIPDWLRGAPKPTYILVRFFGTYDIQWVSANTTQLYEKGIKKKFHSKSKSKAFQKAVKEAKEFVENGIVPEGLTTRPEKVLPDQSQQSADAQESSEDVDGSPSGRQLSGSKRKSPTKRRAASSNKKVKLDDDEEEEEAAPLEATPLPQQEEKEVGKNDDKKPNDNLEKTSSRSL